MSKEVNADEACLKKTGKLQNWKLLSVTNSKHLLLYKLSSFCMTYDSDFVILPLTKTEGFQHLPDNLIAIYVSAMLRNRLVFQEK